VLDALDVFNKGILVRDDDLGSLWVMPVIAFKGVIKTGVSAGQPACKEGSPDKTLSVGPDSLLYLQIECCDYNDNLKNL